MDSKKVNDSILAFSVNQKNNIILLDTDHKKNKSNKIIKRLIDNNYDGLRTFISQNVSSNEKKIIIYLLIHFGGEDDFYKRINIGEETLNSNASRIHYQIYATSNLFKKDIGIFPIKEII